MSVCQGTDTEGLPARAAATELYVLLSRCFEHPNEAFVESVHTGTFEETIHSRATELDIDLPPVPELADLPTVRAAYRRSFESYDGPSASLVESVYREWHDGRERGLLSGPPAHDMQRRYDALDVDVPEQYQPDHLALLLEYASLVLETGELDAYEQFHREHFAWLADFHARVDETCDEPFYRWATTALVRTAEGVDQWIARETDDVGRGQR